MMSEIHANHIYNDEVKRKSGLVIPQLLQLNDFQAIFTQQIQQLSNSTSSKNTSNIVAISNNDGVLQQSIINYYLGQNQRRKKLEDIPHQIYQLRQCLELIKNRLFQYIRNFQSSLSSWGRKIIQRYQILQQQNSSLKKQLGGFSQTFNKVMQQNRQLRVDIRQWQQAKELRRLKQLHRKDPSLSQIQVIIQGKLKQDQSNTLTIKQFNYNQLKSRKPSGFSSSENYNEAQQANLFFRNSQTCSRKKSLFHVSSASSAFGDVRKQNRSKQKLKVFSLQQQ